MKSKTKYSVIELINNNPGETLSNLSDISGRPVTSLSSHLTKLVNSGKIKRKQGKSEVRDTKAYRYFPKTRKQAQASR